MSATVGVAIAGGGRSVHPVRRRARARAWPSTGTPSGRRFPDCQRCAKGEGGGVQRGSLPKVPPVCNLPPPPPPGRPSLGPKSIGNTGRRRKLSFRLHQNSWGGGDRHLVTPPPPPRDPPPAPREPPGSLGAGNCTQSPGFFNFAASPAARILSALDLQPFESPCHLAPLGEVTLPHSDSNDCSSGSDSDQSTVSYATSASTDVSIPRKRPRPRH